MSTRLITVFFLAVSMSQAEDEVASAPLAERSGKPGDSGFRRLTADETGLDFQNLLREENIRKYYYNGAGGCAGDFDGDGLTDLYLVSQDGENRLFRQVESWKFEDVTETAGVGGGDTSGAGAAFADIDGDGDLDLYVCNHGDPNLLFINRGDGAFTEEARAWGLDFEAASVMASFADYDRDGDLDVYVLNNRRVALTEDHPEIKWRMVDGRKTVHEDFAGEYMVLNDNIIELGRPDFLCRNEGNGAFTVVNEFAGPGKDYGHGLSATWWDFNNDGWLDLYVANDFYVGDRLWRNNGNGTFSDVIRDMVPQTPWFAMGSDYGDFNRDGWLDFMVADMSATNHYRSKLTMGVMGRRTWFLESANPRQYMRNAVYLNTGAGRFLESGFLSGLDSTGWTWAARFADLDCDGWEDAIFTNGIARDVNDADYFEKKAALRQAGKLDELQELIRSYRKPGDERNLVFRNRGDLTFENVSEAWNYHDLTASYGLVLADFDRDGDLDAVTNNMNQPAGIYRNDTGSGHRMLIQLRGRQSNPFGIGARLTLKSASGSQQRLLTGTRGYESADEPVVHFGLGPDEKADRLEIRWPSGARQVLEDLEANRIHTIHEPEGVSLTMPAQTSPAAAGLSTLFRETRLPGLETAHRENEFNDFIRQPLLPWKHSRLGPGIACGDADGDGDEDFFVGGASGQTSQLILQLGPGRWAAGPWLPAEADRNSEDMGALWFDPDGDGNTDLFIASGGSDFEPGDEALRNRLHRNRGAQGARREFLPGSENSGVVAAADFDRDGDLDLFVGSRMIPGRFPETPRHRLLLNEGGDFAEAAPELAPDLAGAGMVTSALWTDIDNDGWVDLMMTTAWGPIRVYRNDQGKKLTETTGQAGLAEASGWWQGIDGGDFDGDGDFDYVATNLGRNTKYGAEPDHPFLLYSGDFDGDGGGDLVEAHYEGSTLFPARGLSCSSEAMPFIRERFKTFDAFARADLNTIYTPAKLNEATVHRLTITDHAVLINRGDGRFEIRPLPLTAQLAPGFGVAVDDFDGDGIPDAVLAQNFYSPQPETGRMSGGLSVFLKGEGDGAFRTVPAIESGILIHEDAKSLVRSDLNGDGAPDLLIATNNGPLKTLLNQAGPEGRWTTIVPRGAPGNPTAIGARLEIRTNLGRSQIRETRAGGGYLSQSTARHFVALAADEFVESISVRWPRGESSEVKYEEYGRRIELGTSP